MRGQLSMLKWFRYTSLVQPITDSHQAVAALYSSSDTCTTPGHKSTSRTDSSCCSKSQKAVSCTYLKGCRIRCSQPQDTPGNAFPTSPSCWTNVQSAHSAYLQVYCHTYILYMCTAYTYLCAGVYSVTVHTYLCTAASLSIHITPLTACT